MQLYGGAITIDLDSSWLDASNARPVPDTQEVFTHRDKDLSIIVDVLEPFGSVREYFGALNEHDHVKVQIVGFDDDETKGYTTCYGYHSFETKDGTETTHRLALTLWKFRSDRVNQDITILVTGQGVDGLDEVKEIANTLAKSFKLHDWGLFA